MSNSSPKADALRAMREAQFAGVKPATAPAQALRKAVAAVPAKKAKKPKRKGRL